jgi:hypothetical protein
VSLKLHAPEIGNSRPTDRNAAGTERVFRAVVGDSLGPLLDLNATPQRSHVCRLLALNVIHGATKVWSLSDQKRTSTGRQDWRYRRS